MRSANYEQILATMPLGLDRAVLRVLSMHIGREQAVGREELVQVVASLGFPAHERQVREVIKDLRRRGELICSAAGEDGGYYLAASREEFEEFAQAEFGAKIADMSQTLGAMRQAADSAFGQGMQLGLFG